MTYDLLAVPHLTKPEYHAVGLLKHLGVSRIQSLIFFGSLQTFPVFW